MSQSEMRRGRKAPRFIATLAAAVCAATTIAGCGDGGSSGSADGNVTLRFSWWGSDVRAEATTKAIKEFEKKHPKIKVQTDYAAYGPYWQKIATATAGGDAPDVLQMDYRYISEYGKRNVLLDLSKQSGALPMGDIDPAIAESGKLGDKLLAVPFGQNTTAIAVDKAALTKLGLAPPKAGGSWAEFSAWAKQVNVKSGGKVYGVSDMGYAEDIFELWLRQNGKKLYDGEKFGFTKDDVVKFWTLWQDMVKAKAATPAEISNQYDGTAAKSALVQGKSTAEFIFDNTLKATQAATKNELALAGFPTDGSDSGQYYKPTLLLSASAKTKHPKEAAQLINFLVNDAEAGKILGVDRGLPPNTKVRSTVIPALEPTDQVVVSYEESVKDSLASTPSVPPKGDGEVKTLFQSTYQAVTSGKSSIDEGAEAFMAQAQQAIGG
jgi:multiple sugar transport system substrate-binding protein